MASSDSADPLTSVKENVKPMNSKIVEFHESRAELCNRIQNLKQDLQNWRSKLETQVKSHRHELADLKKSLNLEVEQLRSEFQDLRLTLQQQQDDVTASLKNLGLQDALEDEKAQQNQGGKVNEENAQTVEVESDLEETSLGEKDAGSSRNSEENEVETEVSPAKSDDVEANL